MIRVILKDHEPCGHQECFKAMKCPNCKRFKAHGASVITTKEGYTFNDNNKSKEMEPLEEIEQLHEGLRVKW